MAIWVWFKPETVAICVRKTECCFLFLFGKVLFFFLIRSSSKHDYMSQSEEEILNSTIRTLLGNQSSQERLWESRL